MQAQSTSSSSDFKAENLIHILNVKNAKKVCVLLVLGFIIFHGYLHFQYGNKALLLIIQQITKKKFFRVKLLQLAVVKWSV